MPNSLGICRMVVVRAMNRLWSLILILGFLLPALAGRPAQAQSVPLITGPVDETRLVTVAGNTHPLARPEFDQGIAPGDLPLDRLLLVLKRAPEREAALRQLIEAQHNPGSAQFHQWLTPQQLGEQYGPASEDIQKVSQWLSAHGFSVNRVAAARNVIEFSGIHAQVRETFHTEIHRYLVNGNPHLANASDPKIPSALAPVVAGVASLNNFFQHPAVHPLKPSAASSPQYDDSDGSRYLAPGDFWTIYNVTPVINSGITGAGVTIGIVSQSDILASDISTFWSTYLPGYPNNFVVINNGPDPGIYSEYGDDAESTVDVEWAGALAPDATIKLVVTATPPGTTEGLNLSAQYIVDNNAADVISDSYGLCESQQGTTENQFWAGLWEQAAALGITVSVAAGDSGSDFCDLGNPVALEGLTVSGVASSPYNVAVGGNEFYDESASWYSSAGSIPLPYTSAIGYIAEEVWNESCSPDVCGLADASLWAGSGGASNCATLDESKNCLAGWPKPSWQSGVYGIPNDGVRDLPDVSFSAADHDAYVYQYAGGFALAGGTSFSAPAFAGIMALVNQKTGSRQGQANYVLYQLAASEYGSVGSPNHGNLTAWGDLNVCNSSNGGSVSSTCLFNDVTTGANAVPCAGGTPNCLATTEGAYGVLSGYNATAGYDLATGLGSVNVANLVNAWSSIQPAMAPAALVFSSQTVNTASAAQSVTLTNPLGITLLDIVVSSSGDFSQSNNCGASLLAGASCTINVTFTPTENGPRTGTLTVSRYGGSPIPAVSLTGTGLGAVATFSLTSLSFGSAPVDTIGKTEGMALTNIGSAPLLISGIVAGPGFSQSNNCGTSLAAGAKCAVGVTFTPLSSGSVDGFLTLNSNSVPAPLPVPLSGTGTVPGAVFTTPSLTFANQRVGATSVSQNATLKNNGTAPLFITNFRVSGDFVLSNRCPHELSAGGSCTIAISFLPVARGTVTGTLTLLSDAPQAPSAVALTGTGIDGIAGISPASIDFGAQALGTPSASQPVTLTNSGDAAMTLSRVSTSGHFSQTNNCGAVLAAGANCTFAITFTPLSLDTQGGALVVYDTAINITKFNVQLGGTGTDFSLALSPTSATVTAGASATYGITVAAVDGAYNAAVTLACTSGLPVGATCLFSPSVVTPGSASNSSNLQITTTAGTGGTPTGPYEVIVTGVGGADDHHVKVANLTVQ
jgi:hypothetical protein